jgi:hypothetical protein
MKPVPASLTVNTGEQYKLQNIIEDFFTETRDAVAERFGFTEMPPIKFEIRSGEISYTQQITDDRMTYLLYDDMPIACVLATRTEFNYVRYVFFRNLESLDRNPKHGESPKVFK